MKQFKDPITGKTFKIGKLGVDPLLERVKDYVAGREEAGVSEVSLEPSKMDAGATFKCSACQEEFVYGGDDQPTFIESIKQHGRAHGVCQILPVL